MSQRRNTLGTTSTKNATVRRQRLHQSLLVQLPSRLSTSRSTTDETKPLCHDRAYHRTSTRTSTTGMEDYTRTRCTLVYEKDYGRTVPDPRRTNRMRERPEDDHHREVHGDQDDISTENQR
eukprot:1129630-Amphidinium_carterae.1